jgi:putrescine aminotransferase
MKKIYKLSEIQNINSNTIKKIYKKNINPGLINAVNIFSFSNDVVNNSFKEYIYLKNKKKILDLTGGYGVLSHGHNNSRIIKARIKFQKEKRMEVHKNFLSQYLACLSNNIANLLPGTLNKVFLPNSGAEANEGAIKLAYKYHAGNRKYILHSDISFHGKLLGTASISANPELNFNFPGLEYKDIFKYNDINSVKKLLSKYKNDIYSIIIEPFSASTLSTCSKEFFVELRKICSDNKIILIFDEVFTSWAKTGKLFYFEYVDIIPDIVTFSKSFGGGKSSISGYVSTDEVYNKAYLKEKNFNLHSSTYNGFGEEAITALEAINIILEGNYCNKAIRIGKFIDEQFKIIINKYPMYNIKVLGVGSLKGFTIELPNNYLSKLKSFFPKKFQRFIEKLIFAAIVEEFYSKSKILTTFSSNKTIVFYILPPLEIGEKNLKYFFSSLDKILKKGLIKIIYKLSKNLIFK